VGGEKRGPRFVVGTYVNAAWEVTFGGEDQIKLELVSPNIQSTVAAQYLLVLEEGSITLWRKLVARGTRWNGAVVEGRRALPDTDEAMESDYEVGDAKGFRDDEDYGSLDMVACRIGAVGFVGAYVEVL